MRNPSASILLVTLVAGGVLLPGTGTAPLWDEDEPKNAACSLAMLDSGNWIVPTFNGELRVEKPPLVNWVQLAGISFFGRNEAGVRAGSIVLTLGTCLLTLGLGRILAGPTAGLLCGLIMASCFWTAVGGRAATPDAPLIFCTTLTATIFAHALRSSNSPSISRLHAIGIGLACGCGILAKGPVGLILPFAGCSLCCWILRGAQSDSGWLTGLGQAIRGMRPLTCCGVALAVAFPWYALVSISTHGEWLREFLLVHNAGRFAAPMEGHSGSLLYYPFIMAIGLFPWSLVLLAVPLHSWFVWRSAPAHDERRRALAFAGSWAITWIGAFSLAGTKLPGYIWPAYPALALATAIYLADWVDQRTGWEQRLFRYLTADAVLLIGWGSLACVGAGFLIGLPLVARQFAPGTEWLGLIGLLLIIAAVLAVVLQHRQRRRDSLVVLTATAVLFLGFLGGVVAVQLARHQGTGTLLANLPPQARQGSWASLHPARPSLVFYTGGQVADLPDIEAGIAHLEMSSHARLVVQTSVLEELLPLLPTDCQILGEKPASFDPGLVVVGRLQPHQSPAFAHQSNSRPITLPIRPETL
jgi:4-amino-4-deoxy-L-arabinose transferase-like glycosyltransferase